MNELKKCGFELIEPAENELSWDGKLVQPENEIVITTYDDHRMAMAFAPIALKKTIIIEHPEVVNKSYPLFWEELSRLNNL